MGTYILGARGKDYDVFLALSNGDYVRLFTISNPDEDPEMLQIMAERVVDALEMADYLRETGKQCVRDIPPTREA